MEAFRSKIRTHILGLPVGSFERNVARTVLGETFGNRAGNPADLINSMIQANLGQRWRVRFDEIAADRLRDELDALKVILEFTHV